MPSLLLTDPPYCSGGFQEAGQVGGSIGSNAKIKWGENGPEIHNDKMSTRGYQRLIKSMLELSSCGQCYIFTDWRMWINLFDVVEANGFSVRSMIVWDKETAGMGQGWRAQHELILYGMKVKHSFDLKNGVGNVLKFQRTGNKNHPTEKPVELLRTILNVHRPSGAVYDPFGGSGSTLIACEAEAISCCMMEIDPHYCDVVLQRWEDLTGDKAVKVA